MTDTVATFFGAWGDANPDSQAATLASTLGESFAYADPRTPEPITDGADLASYVAEFAKNAPGWTAKVIDLSETAGYQRATVAFGGKGPDGSEMAQHGQYFASLDDSGKITQLIGFIGTGTPG